MSEQHSSRAARPGLTAPRTVRLQSMIVLLNVAFTVLLLRVADDGSAGATWARSGMLLSLILVQQLVVVAVLSPIRRVERLVDRHWKELRGKHDVTPDDQTATETVERKLETVLEAHGARTDHARDVALALYEQRVEENARTARQLFDSTAQELAGLLLEISATLSGDPAAVPSRLEGMRLIGSHLLGEVTELAGNLYSHELDKNGLAPALQQLGRIYSRGNGIDIDVETVDSSAVDDSVRKTIFFHIADEALRNAVRHGAPSRIDIRLLRMGASYVLEVRDDGRGFDVGSSQPHAVSAGMSRIFEEAALVGGKVEFRSAPGNGTSVVTTIPCAPPEDAPTKTSYDVFRTRAVLGAAAVSGIHTGGRNGR